MTSFLLSPADVGGRRAQILMSERAEFPLAVRFRAAGAPLGEVFAFLSGLYFRGKLAYATRFAATPRHVAIITTNRGLLGADLIVTAADLRSFGTVDIGADEPVYRASLERDARTLPDGPVVLLGSLATAKYLAVLIHILGDRLHYPKEFVGLGDMSRGSILLKAAAAGRELEYGRAVDLPMPKIPARRQKTAR